MSTEVETSAATFGVTSEGIGRTEPEMFRLRITEIPTTQLQQTSTSERFIDNNSGNTEAVIMQTQTNGTTNQVMTKLGTKKRVEFKCNVRNHFLPGKNWRLHARK